MSLDLIYSYLDYWSPGMDDIWNRERTYCFDPEEFGSYGIEYLSVGFQLKIFWKIIKRGYVIISIDLDNWLS